MTANLELFTIGAYGTDADGFFAVLKEHKIDVLADIRWRRGVRGAEYAWANRARLEARCEADGILCWHNQALAPSPEIRAVQYEADKAGKVKKRERQTISDSFRTAYQQQVLAGINLQDVVNELLGLLPERSEPVRVCFFCVERAAEACHRSLLTQALSNQFGWSVTHLMPGPGATGK